MRLKSAWDQELCHVLLFSSLPCRDPGLFAFQDCVPYPDRFHRAVTKFIQDPNMSGKDREKPAKRK